MQVLDLVLGQLRSAESASAALSVATHATYAARAPPGAVYTLPLSSPAKPSAADPRRGDGGERV